MSLLYIMTGPLTSVVILAAASVSPKVPAQSLPHTSTKNTPRGSMQRADLALACSGHDGLSTESLIGIAGECSL